jgi:PAS domain-containing protein
VTKDSVTKALHARELQVIVCTDAASEGLNLQAAGAVINYDLPWNPSRVEQRIGRIDRIGQKFSHVRIVNLFLKDSVDDKVYRALQSRCGLFRHFVGPMQPVLARARKMLLGQEPIDLHILDSTASQVDHDPLSLETYMECEAGEDRQVASPITRDDLEFAMSLIKDDFGPKVKQDKEKTRYRISGQGFGKAAFSLKMDILEHDRAILPLTPLETRLRDLAESLCQAGERLPLVLGSAQRGHFRCTVACWVGQKDWHPILSIDDLKKYVENWQGDYPRVDLWLRAETAAREEAAAQVYRMEERAAQREQMALNSQKEAARIRLQRELGRYLVCLNAGTTDLNALFHNQMTRDIATAQRLRKCIDKLGGYPEWQPELIRELDLFGQHLSENQRKARLLGREIDAALEDPRWTAAAFSK